MPVLISVLRPVAVVLLVFGLSGCTAVDQLGSAASPVADAVALTGVERSDRGNGRPQVSFDGLMVRRRVVVAISPNATADLVALRGQLDQAADSLRLRLSDIAPTVLDAEVLEQLAPELIIALPEGGTVSDAGKILDLISSSDGAFRGGVQLHVGSVLVHDLRFAVLTRDPGALQESIDREGILSDALGNYRMTARTNELRIDYTGPLLSDDLIQSVRAGIARPADAEPDEVSVSPRSAAGLGVDMKMEPAPGEQTAPTPHNQPAH